MNRTRRKNCHIEKLAINLPHMSEHDARTLAQVVQTQLARIDISNGHIGTQKQTTHLSVSLTQAHDGESPVHLASRVVGQAEQLLGGE